MKVVDLKELEPDDGSEVFYKAEEFSGRVIELPPGGSMPPCEMDSYVMFYFVAGEAKLTVNGEETELREGMSLITEPATLSMETEEGTKILGVQIATTDI